MMSDSSAGGGDGEVGTSLVSLQEGGNNNNGCL